jgi:hypothetical protein
MSHAHRPFRLGDRAQQTPRQTNAHPDRDICVAWDCRQEHANEVPETDRLPGGHEVAASTTAV